MIVAFRVYFLCNLLSEKLAAALETAPISVCVNAGTWDDYTGGIISGAACAADADLQEH